MSATTFPQPRAPAVTHVRTARTARLPEPETSSDDGYLIKVTAGVLLVTLTVAIIAPLGWAILPAAVAILLATTAAVVHATFRLLNESDEEGLMTSIAAELPRRLAERNEPETRQPELTAGSCRPIPRNHKTVVKEDTMTTTKHQPPMQITSTSEIARHVDGRPHGHVVGHAVGERLPRPIQGRPRGRVVGHAVGEPLPHPVAGRSRGHVVGHASGEPLPPSLDGRPQGHVVGHKLCGDMPTPHPEAGRGRRAPARSL